MAGTLLSMLRTGHVDGRWNNFFHLPILTGLPALPQFAGDAYVQTLPFYASGFWQFFAGRVPLESVPAFLLGWAILSRFLSIAAFLALGDLLGIRSLRERLIFVTLVAFSSVLIGASSAGAGGLFINYFTHSELANASLLFTVWLVARRRYAGAMAVNGITFFLNAFMAVWAVAPMAAIALMQWRRGEASLRSILGGVAIGTPIFLLAAFPTLKAILANPAFGRPPGFDYVAFLESYAPVHFLPWALGPVTLAVFALVAATGFSAAWMLAHTDRQAAFCRDALVGAGLLWLAGTVLPLLTGSPALLNLHLLRSGVVVHLFGGLAIAALSVLWLREKGLRRNVWAPLLILGVSLGRMLLPLTLAAIWLGQGRRLVDLRWRLDRVAMAVLAPLWVLQIGLELRGNANAMADAESWRTLGRWAKQHSATDAIFLLPVSTDINRYGRWQALPDQEALNDGAELFQVTAERPVWFDFRSGAAVMWSPGYHPVWSRRVAEVMSLPDHAQRMAYARTHGIAYLIDACGAGGDRPLFQTDRRCVYASSVTVTAR